MFVVLTIAWCCSLTYLFWSTVQSYLGRAMATALTIGAIVLVLIALNWFDNLPTKDELKQYERHKRNMGQ